MKLLHLDTSILGSNSVSRALSAEIVAREVALHPGLEVTYRDLVADKALHLSGAHLAAFQGGAADAVRWAPISPTVRGVYGRAVRGRHRGDRAAYVQLLDPQPVEGVDRPGDRGGEDVPPMARTACRQGMVTGKKLIIASARGGVYSAGQPGGGVRASGELPDQRAGLPGHARRHRGAGRRAWRAGRRSARRRSPRRGRRSPRWRRSAGPARRAGMTPSAKPTIKLAAILALLAGLAVTALLVLRYGAGDVWHGMAVVGVARVRRADRRACCC